MGHIITSINVFISFDWWNKCLNTALSLQSKVSDSSKESEVGFVIHTQFQVTNYELLSQA